MPIIRKYCIPTQLYYVRCRKCPSSAPNPTRHSFRCRKYPSCAPNCNPPQLPVQKNTLSCTKKVRTGRVRTFSYLSGRGLLTFWGIVMLLVLSWAVALPSWTSVVAFSPWTAVVVPALSALWSWTAYRLYITLRFLKKNLA